MQALPKLRTRDADTTSYVADYLTRSVRRASGLILVGKPEIGTCLRWGMHQKRTARKSRSGELCFTVLLNYTVSGAPTHYRTLPPATATKRLVVARLVARVVVLTVFLGKRKSAGLKSLPLRQSFKARKRGGSIHIFFCPGRICGRARLQSRDMARANITDSNS